MQILGIDISKKQLDVALLLEKEKVQYKVFSNCLEGFNQLDQWIKNKINNKVLLCMEATGIYGDPLADFFYSQNYDVSVVNPVCIKAYAKSKLIRHKTDKVDAEHIAEYALKHNVPLWKPNNPVLRELKELFRCSQAIKQQLNQVTNHLGNKNLPEVVAKIWKELKLQLEQQILNIENSAIKLITEHPDLYQDYLNLQTIPGISKKTALALIAEIPNLASFKSARQLAAYAGLTPQHKTSGSSVRGKSRLSKIGSVNLRKALYFPAIVANKYNPILASFCQNLKEKGKHTMVIIAAAMRKLLHIIYGVLKSKTTFNYYNV